MKRSQINRSIQNATAFFEDNCWHLPPKPKWDVTDFGLGNFDKYGLVLINLAEEEEYCEKLMYAVKNQITPIHAHKKKKEDIICRVGKLVLQVWKNVPSDKQDYFSIQINGSTKLVHSGEKVMLNSGERITLVQGIYHKFYPESEQCIIGEVSTANDDLNDNFFVNPNVGRFSKIEEDEAPLVRLISESI